ncbi:MAG TPA: ATP-binding protein [Kiritimatiellia bacterium]|nr:ATP-binding protein [Kiritimatiellia bacterium]
MNGSRLFPRFIQARLSEALADNPVVLIHGPRQCGKTTLALTMDAADRYAYVSFDDDVKREAARLDPIGFVKDLPERVVLDEIQRVPDLFTSIKLAVDRRRQPGRFVLTGSSNVLLVPKLADSLAGRMAILRLHPLAQAELAGHRPGFLDKLFQRRFKARAVDRLGSELAQRIADGGFPAALARATPRRRSAWYRDYADTLAQKDMRDLARIQGLDTIPRLLSLAAAQSARLFNVSDLAAPFQLSRPTVRDYMILLERLFVVTRLPAWHGNRLTRLVKTPKLHLGDTGLACAVLGLDADALWTDRALLGQLVETFVCQELVRQASWSDDPVTFGHYRDRDGAEVDLVLETGSRLAGVEVKTGATVRPDDFRGLRKLKAAAGEKFASGVVLYDGETTASFGDDMIAVPIRNLWET